MSESAVKAVPFPRVVWVALALEFLERLAFYGVYVNLGVYLTGTVGFTDKENGALLGVFALVRSWVPIVTGSMADRIGFRRSLALSFVLYMGAYATLFLAPSRAGAWAAVMGMAFGGAFLKPVVPGTVRRHSPDGRQAMGFSLFYASVNAGSVVGKIATAIVRTTISLQASMVNAIVACAAGLAVALGAYREPPAPVEPADASKPEKPTETSLVAALVDVSKKPALIVFLLLISGYYLLIEQFYQTFPTFLARVHGEDAPREYITLINPAAIAILQVPLAGLTKRLPAPVSIAIGVLISAVSMLIMGSVPTLAGPIISYFVFAIAEMVLSPRYYEYVSSFAPKGREGLYMGLAIAPFGIGGLVGGILSGRLIDAYLPKGGPHQPLMVWGTYAAIGVVCSAAIGLFAILTRKKA